MPRIAALDPAAATGAARKLLDAVHSKLGLTPNLMRTLAHAPSALEGYLNLNDALSRGVLDHRFREQIALAVAQANACGYCLAAHTALGTLAGLTPDEIARSRGSRSLDPRGQAGLQFAHAVVTSRGQVSDASLKAVRDAGFSDVEITEIVANVVLNVFTNYINLVAQTAVDFPPVPVELTAVA
jgi:uncharacterized peroxidase-related enzyme